MMITQEGRRQIEAFFVSADLKKAHQLGDPQFCFIAIKYGTEYRIIQARLLYNFKKPSAHCLSFESERVRAGVYSLSEIGLTPRQLADRLLEGQIETPGGILRFIGNEAGGYGAQYNELHPEGLKAQLRFETLTILGGRNEEQMLGHSLDWELKASNTPYDNLQELAFDYQCAEIRDVYNVEFVLANLAVIDHTSSLAGEEASVAVRLSNGLPTGELTLGYRLFSGGKVTKRARIEGRDMVWSQEDEHQRGSIEIGVPKGAVLNFVVNFAGIAQHQSWLSDATAMQNSRRAVYEVFDPKLGALNDIITKAHTRGRDARDFEAGVAWLLWMLGFSVAQIGGLPRTQQDFADLVVATPIGHFVVVECTTGLLKANNKLPLLVQRTELTRQALLASNNQHLRVLAVLVTSRTRREVVADIEQAERLGVFVATAETLVDGFQRTVLLPDADRLFAELDELIAASLTKHSLQ